MWGGGVMGKRENDMGVGFEADADLVEVGRRGSYRLLRRHKAGDWVNLKLVDDTPSHQPSDKRNWWLAHNGDRLSQGRDAGLLARHQPDIYAWVVSIGGADIHA